MYRLLIAAVLASSVLPLLAEDAPEKAVVAYFAGTTGTNFDAAVKLVHPTDLAKLKDSVLPFLDKSAQTNGFPPKLTPFTRDNTVEEVRKLTGEEVYIRLMTWATTVNPMWVTILKATTMEPLGTVKEGDLVHVVCRQTTAIDTNAPRTSPVVVTVMKDAGAWKVTQPSELQMIVQQFTRPIMPSTRPAMRTPPQSGSMRPMTLGPVQPGGTDAHAGHNHPPAAPSLQPSAPVPAAPASTPAVSPAPAAK